MDIIKQFVLKIHRFAFLSNKPLPSFNNKQTTNNHHMIIFSSGEFGIVYKAHLLPQVKLDSKLSSCPLPQTVAVKTLKGKYHILALYVDVLIIKFQLQDTLVARRLIT